MPEWDELVDQHARFVFGVAFRITGSIHDAEDVAQETFREVFELADRRKVTDWRGFLRRLATFRAIDSVRRRRSQSLSKEHVSPLAGPVDECAARELAARVPAALGELPPQPAAVFSLTYFEQLSRDEIATTLAMTPEAVSAALFKARRRMEEILFPRSPKQKELSHEHRS